MYYCCREEFTRTDDRWFQRKGIIVAGGGADQLPWKGEKLLPERFHGEGLSRYKILNNAMRRGRGASNWWHWLCVCEEVNEEDDVSVTITNARIIGVIQLDKYRACLKCKARVEPLNPPPLGRCSKSDCLMTQRCMIFVQRASGSCFLCTVLNWVHTLCTLLDRLCRSWLTRLQLMRSQAKRYWNVDRTLKSLLMRELSSLMWRKQIRLVAFVMFD